MSLLLARDLAVGVPDYGSHQAAPDPVVRGVSLALEAGEWLALTGPNGGGKTSLLLTLAGLWPPRSGEVELDGLPLGPVPPETPGRPAPPARSDLAVILQDPGVQLLQPTVAEELAFTARNLDRPADRIADALVRWIGRFGLGPLLARDPRTLSAGQQQLVLIAAALIAEPRLLIADEPGAHLDPGSRALVLSAIRAEVDRGLGVVWATQDPLEIAHADRSLRLGEAFAPALPSGEGLAPEGSLLLTLEVAAAGRGVGPRVATERPFSIPIRTRGVTALMGSNGSGKSVLLAAAAGWSPIPQVRARWEVPPRPPPILATQYPELQLFEEVVADELVWAAASRGLERGRVLTLAGRILDALGIEPGAFLGRRLWSLSGGERRIAGLVGALVTPAALRILDEPTAGLDPGRRAALAGVLRGLAREVPVLLASQDQPWVNSLDAHTFEVGAGAWSGAPSPSKKTD